MQMKWRMTWTHTTLTHRLDIYIYAFDQLSVYIYRQARFIEQPAAIPAPCLLFGCLVACLHASLIGWSVEWLVGWLVDGLAAGCWLARWLAGCLAGWRCGCKPAPSLRELDIHPTQCRMKVDPCFSIRIVSWDMHRTQHRRRVNSCLPLKALHGGDAGHLPWDMHRGTFSLGTWSLEHGPRKMFLGTCSLEHVLTLMPTQPHVHPAPWVQSIIDMH